MTGDLIHKMTMSSDFCLLLNHFNLSLDFTTSFFHCFYFLFYILSYISFNLHDPYIQWRNLTEYKNNNKICTIYVLRWERFVTAQKRELLWSTYMLYTTFVTEPDWLEFGMKCLPSLLLYILKCLLIRKSAKTIVDNAQDCQSF